MVGWNVDISSLSPPLTIARENMVNPNMNSDSRSTVELISRDTSC